MNGDGKAEADRFGADPMLATWPVGVTLARTGRHAISNTRIRYSEPLRDAPGLGATDPSFEARPESFAAIYPLTEKIVRAPISCTGRLLGPPVISWS